MNINHVNRKLSALFGDKVSCREEDGCRILSGKLEEWEDVIKACSVAVSKNKQEHVVNDIEFDGFSGDFRKPSFTDSSLEGKSPDVLIVGGGISGASIARELRRFDISVLLVDKETDLAAHASSRNDGEVHPGVDLSKGTLKQKYVVRGNRMYEQVCKELDVPFKRTGQYAGFTSAWLRPFVSLLCFQRKYVCGIDDTRIVGRKWLKEHESGLNPDFKFAIYNPMAGVVSPYGLTIAYAENAVANGAEVSLETAVLSMDVKNGHIEAVHTNRGTVYPKLVINAAGVFADVVAQMAGDRFFSIHPRKGTNSITDKKSSCFISSIASIKKVSLKKTHTKGGGTMQTVHGNLLLGPDAVETYERENFATEQKSIDTVFSKQKETVSAVSKRDIITYFTGVRAATFEEDYILERGRKTSNIIHVAGIQSPGLTTAPAIAQDISIMVKDILKASENKNFNPIRKGIPKLAAMSLEERNSMILKNPDYGVIVCRCEEISKGEILDALSSNIPVHTIDAVKRRVRPGMGRCQGGFCMPLVAKIIAEKDEIPLRTVRKNGQGSEIGYERI